jgi:hypothetical protein
LAEVVVPQLLLDFISELDILLLRDGLSTRENLLSNPGVSSQEISITCLNVTAVKKLARILLVLTELGGSPVPGHAL